MRNSASKYAPYDAYKRVDVETASQGKLVVMLFNGAIQRAQEARRLMDGGRRDAVHNHLIRAQEIITELRSSLNMGVGEVARNLDRIYEYFQHLLVQANVRRDVQSLDQCVEMMTEMRDTWVEAFDKAEKEKQPAANSNQHGSAVMNLQG